MPGTGVEFIGRAIGIVFRLRGLNELDRLVALFYATPESEPELQDIVTLDGNTVILG